MSRPGEPGAPPEVAARLHGWLHPAILAAAALSVASGFAQFGVFTALADVATAFGQGAGAGVAAELGLSGTTLGLGLGIIRLAALGSLPLSSMADHVGRKRVLLTSCAAGLALTAVAAVAPGYWFFIALFALGRPLLSTTNNIVSVIAAEETSTRDRAKSIALITAAYGTGAGIPALVRALDERLLGDALGFRGLFALALVPLLFVPLLGRVIEEPERFSRLLRTGHENRMGLGAVPAELWPRLALVCLLTFAATFTAQPVTGYVFAYAEGVLQVSSTFTFGVVLAAAPLGLAGLLFGRWAADVWGRRWTCVAMHVLAGIAGIATYRGGITIAVAGYLGVLVAGSAYAPSVGALSAEVFPTADRATAAGWITAASAVGAVLGLVTFGVLSDALGGFGSAAVAISLPVILTAPLYLWLPETQGLELEQSAPEPA